MTNVPKYPDWLELAANAKRIGEGCLISKERIRARMRAMRPATLKICELLLEARRRLPDKDFDEWYDSMNIFISSDNLTENDHE